MEAGKTSQEEKVIIQCPKCQTKFSVSSEMISELELPRFHCSRCDNVFDMDPRTSASFEESDIAAAVAAADTTSAVDAPPQKEENDETEVAQLENARTMEINKDTLAQISDIIKANAPVEEEESDPQDSSEQTPVFSLDIPSSYQPAPPDSIARAISQDSQEVSPSAKQLSMNLTSQSESASGDEYSMPYGVTIGNSYEKFASEREVSRQDNPVLEELPDPLPDNSEGVIEHLPRFDKFPTVPRQPGGASLIVTPILLTLFLAGILSFVVARSPGIAETVAGHLGAPLAKFPPTGIYMEEIKFHNLALESGETVRVISGTVKNDSDKSVKNVVVEGFAFGKDGSILESVRVNAGTGFDAGKAAKLSLEEIRNNKIRGKNADLPPNSKTHFVIPLSEQNNTAAKPEFFSARIHSVTM